MERDDDSKLDHELPGLKADYPYGLRICLTHEELAKLGIDDDPEVGDMLHFAAMAEVTSYTKGDGEMGAHRRVELQIKLISHMENESTEA